MRQEALGDARAITKATSTGVNHSARVAGSLRPTSVLEESPSCRLVGVHAPKSSHVVNERPKAHRLWILQNPRISRNQALY